VKSGLCLSFPCQSNLVSSVSPPLVASERGLRATELLGRQDVGAICTHFPFHASYGALRAGACFQHAGRCHHRAIIDGRTLGGSPQLARAISPSLWATFLRDTGCLPWAPER